MKRSVAKLLDWYSKVPVLPRVLAAFMWFLAAGFTGSVGLPSDTSTPLFVIGVIMLVLALAVPYHSHCEKEQDK